MTLAERMGLNGDALAALQYGMSVDKYIKIKQAYIDTYKVVTPMEGVPLIQREPDGTILARKAIPWRGWKTMSRIKY